MQHIVWQSRPLVPGDVLVIVEGLMDGYRMAGVPGVVVMAVLIERPFRVSDPPTALQPALAGQE